MIRENLIKAIIALVVFVLFMSTLGYLFEAELTVATDWLVSRIGFLGLCLILLVTDTLVTPFPPDILLLVIAKSPLAQYWSTYVLVLGIVSSIAGMLGWGIGRRLGHLEFVKRNLGEFKEDHREFIRRYGYWAVAIGSITPFPFSLTCWAAGVMGLRGITVFLAALTFRIPRFFLYYWLIAYTGNWF
ncbi:YqaA family protein [Nitrosomonas nitrosa]|jgi:membrane protein YqaA with SNARE-associated domain|uniref:YqaA family protein n=1 Tax=Nitrosomonas nitrosa TaxID=52442 RepID=UPI0023F785C0|nr:VTT domain-containing protein [Nitrosomonas nitrosa]MCO6433085.1 VTT domain-containing protein [Nitrosomonas nitrosa]